METIRANEYHDLVSVTDPQVSPDGELAQSHLAAQRRSVAEW
ncbi:hypothetical protein [Haladaptatus sp. W1]|nr:hypothetical protein [Haladaptatus sp. W1]